MTAKEYLSRAIYARQHVQACMEQLEQLRADRQRIGCTLGHESGGGSSLPGDPVGALAVRIVDAEQRLLREAQDWRDIYDEVSEVIGQVQEPRLRDVLSRRYLMGERWEEIISAFGPVDARTVYRWHGEALKEVGRLLYRYE